MSAEGNVRYVSQNMTMYGSRMDYNLNTGYFSAENARILGGEYVILGKKLVRISPEVIIGEDAEYTTCRDCPESWSIFGRNVHITLDEYIRVKHAYLKIKGMITTYIPYIVFPIKKNREMGLLFPKFGYRRKEGFQYQQPWFLPMSESADLTLTPSMFGRRGWGYEFQLRQIVKDGFWYETNSVQVWDQVYQPGRNSDLESGTTFFRNLTDWEHHFFSGKNINHHTYVNGVNDLDMVPDYIRILDEKVSAVDYGIDSFLDLRQNWFSLSAESYFMRNGLFNNPKGFDHRYVQILPKVSFNTIPIHFFQTDNMLLNRMSFLGQVDHTTFKQNHFEEGEYIRNANRLNATPSLDINLATLGPVNLKTNAKLDYQHYRFPHEELQKSFTKLGIIYETEASFTLDKIYGLAYEQRIPMKDVILKEEEEEKQTFDDIIGDLPDFSEKYNNADFTYIKSSYRHRQEYKFKHYFISDQDIKGNQRFKSQILDEGQFDDLDVIRDQQTEFNTNASKEALPLANTFELQWNNSLVRKVPVKSNLLSDGNSVRDNFVYDNVGYFNLSQGIFRNRNENNEPHYLLTRLRLNTGIHLPTASLHFNEFYYYYTQEHNFTFHFQKNFKYFDIDLGARYNSFIEPVQKFITLGTEIRLLEQFRFRTQANYDYDEQRMDRTQYEMLYMPSNNCWRFNVVYERDRRGDSDISFNFLLNYNRNSFSGTENER